VSLPKNPEKWHWRKRFLMPKAYLYKLHVLLGYNAREISAIHKNNLGVSVSERTVRGYLHKYGIYESREKFEKAKKKKIRGPRSKGVAYLNHRLFIKREVKTYLDSLNKWYRREVLNKFFRSVVKRGHLTESEERTIRFIIKNYEVSSTVIDLVIPNRQVMIDWPKIEEARKEMGVSRYAFCKKTGLDIPTYRMVQKKGMKKKGFRKTVLKISSAFRINPSEISREITE